MEADHGRNDGPNEDLPRRTTGVSLQGAVSDVDDQVAVRKGLLAGAAVTVAGAICRQVLCVPATEQTDCAPFCSSQNSPGI
jgi:hypothetical protein